jgi:hypothetical protein
MIQTEEHRIARPKNAPGQNRSRFEAVKSRRQRGPKAPGVIGVDRLKEPS